MHTPKSFSRHALLRAVRMPALALVLSPLPSAAQVVRGIVVDEASGRGLPGVVVVLLDSAGNRLAGVLADDEGRYAIRTTIAGRYAVRAERIGYRADAATPVALGVGQTVELRLVTRPIPVILGAVRVTGRSPCVTRASDGREVSEVWEETRKALYATDLTQRQELFTARVSRYERTLDAHTGRVTAYQTKEATAVTRSPFVSEKAAELSARGYVRQGSSETVYFAPDAGVLLSDEFLRDHCFRLREGQGRRSGQLGLAFEPVKGREQADIVGTLWIDRKTAELRDLDFAYSRLPSLPSTAKSDDFGGRIEFHRMPTGAWIVERWMIRMPVLVDKGAFAGQPTTVVPGSAPMRRERIELAAVHEEGGEVVETISRGGRHEVVSAVASVRGTVFDSTRMRPLAGARVFLDGTQFATQSAADGSFTIAQVPPGTYAVSVMHPRFDSLSIVAPSATVELPANKEAVAMLAGPSAATIIQRDCAAEARAAGRATLRGRVRDGFTSAPAIDAQVTVSWTRLEGPGSRTAAIGEPRIVTRTDSAGRYDVCGLPDGVRLTAIVTSNDRRRSAPVQMILPADEVSVVDVVVGTPTVVATSEPAPVTAPVAKAAMPRATKNRTMAEFERRRRRGNGAYLTRDRIDQMHASRLTDLLRTLPGVSVEPNESGALVVELRQSTSFSFEPAPVARNDSASASAPQQPPGRINVRKCPASFQVDGLAIDGGATVDIDVRPETIEAIEVYSGGQVPIELGARNAECGVVLIWTRAFAERSTPAPGSDGHR